MYYDRQGQPLTMAQWATLVKQSSYRRVAETTLWDGKWVSTVWLGLDHSFGSGAPVIFETMVFPAKDDFEELDSRRYRTEAEALAGHDALVREYSPDHRAIRVRDTP